MSKVKRNNHVRPAAGEPDIECLCMFDTDLSRMHFEENFEVLQHSGYRSTSVCYYIDNGNVEGPEKIKFTVKGERKAKIDYLAKQTSFETEEIETWDDDTLDAEILGYESDVNLINYALERMPDAPEGLEFIPSKELKTFSTSGYSQGDYSVVIYCPEDLEKAWGNRPDEKQLQKMIHHYYWDAPIFCRFDIDGKEYSYYDMPKADEYEWDRDAFLDYVSKESKIDRDKLESFVPDYPEYP